MARETTLAVRFTTKDAETVRAALKNMGAEGERALKGIDRAAKAAKPSTKALVAAADDLRTGMENVAGDIPGVSAGLRSIGPAGVVAAGALGVAAAGAMALARGAIEAGRRAADLVDETQKIGIGVEAFQELKFAADESGVAVEAVGPALDGLNSSIGAIKSGLGDIRKIEAFKAIGISADQVRGFNSLEEALPVIADALANVQNQAERVKIAEALGIRELLPVMDQGSDGLRRMADRARELGVVIDEDLIHQADKANREIEIATTQMGVAFEKLKLAALPQITAIINGLADLITKSGEAVGALNRVTERHQRVAAETGMFMGRRVAPEAQVRLRGQYGRSLPGTSANDPQNKSLTLDETRKLLPAVKEAQSVLSKSGRRSGDATSFDPEADAEMLAQARMDQLRAAEVLADDAKSRAAASRARLAAELAETEATIQAQRNVSDDARAAAVAAARTSAAVEERSINEREQAELARLAADRARDLDAEIQAQTEQRRTDARMVADAESMDLETARDRAETRQEQLSVEREILELAYRRQRAEILASDASKDAKAIALAALERSRQVANQGLSDRYADGLQRARRELETESRAIDDELADIAAGGLKDLEDGLLSVINGTKSTKEAFSDMAAGILADLARLAIRQWAILPLMEMLGLGNPAGNTGGLFGSGGSGGSLGSILTNILSPGGGFGGLGRRAGGGAVNAGGAYLIGERGPELFMPGIGGSVMPNHALAALGGAGGGGLTVNIHNAPLGTTATQRADGTLDVVVGRLDALENRVARREASFGTDVTTVVLDGMRRRRF